MRLALALLLLTACQFTLAGGSDRDAGPEAGPEAGTCALGQAGPSCAACPEGKLAIQACTNDFIDCAEWIDGDNNSSTSNSCPANNCATNVDFDLGARKFVNRLRFLSDWFNKRPGTWALLASDDNVNFSAVVINARSNRASWRCVAGDACTPEVPEVCCPGGVTQETTAVGTMYPKWDDFGFSGVTARYWRFRINTTDDPNSLIMRELELYGHDCLGEMACATSSCGTGVCTGQEQARCTCASCDAMAFCISAFTGVAPACTTN